MLRLSSPCRLKVVWAWLPVLASLAGKDWVEEGGYMYVRIPVEAGMPDKVAPQGRTQPPQHHSLRPGPGACDEAVPPHLCTPLGEEHATQRAALSRRTCLRT